MFADVDTARPDRDAGIEHSGHYPGTEATAAQKQGYVFKVPSFCYGNLSMNAVFTASTNKVRSYVPHPDMHPVEIFPGRCLLSFTAFEYRKTDLDPYNEFSLYVWHLPVTTETARVGGVEFFGYLKFIADIEFTRSGDKLRCDLSEKGSRILSMEGKMLPTEPGKRLRYITYSLNGGVPLVTNICVNPLQFAQSRASDAVSLEIDGDHPIAKELQEIDISDTPTAYQYSPNNEAILFAGRNLMDA